MRVKRARDSHNWIHRKYGIDGNLLSLISSDVYKRIVKGWKRIGDQLDFIDERIGPGFGLFEEDLYPHKLDKLRHSFLKGAYDFLQTYAITAREVGVCYDALVYTFIASIGHAEVAKAAYEISAPESKHNQSINKFMQQSKGMSEAFWYIQNALACFGVGCLLNENEEETLRFKAHPSIDFDSDRNGRVVEVYKNIARVAKDKNGWKDLHYDKTLEGWLKLPTQEKLKRLHTDGRLLDQLQAERKKLVEHKMWSHDVVSESDNPISQEIAENIRREARRTKDSPLGDEKLMQTKRLWEDVIEPSVLSEIQEGLREVMAEIDPLDGQDKRKLRHTAGQLVYLSRKIEKALDSKEPKASIDSISLDEDTWEGAECLDESEDEVMIEL